MKWSHTPPRDVGWYWWKPAREALAGACLYPIVVRVDPPIVVLEPDPDDEYGWYAGPIPQPEDP